MVVKTPRRRLAEYVADALTREDESIVRKLAALIVIEDREREIDLIARDIEDKLADRGILIATVETATALTAEIRREITKMFNYSEVRLREIVDPELIGGVRVRTPGAVMDKTVARKMHSLRSKKI